MNRRILATLPVLLPLCAAAAAPLRYENIRDEEVREIQQVVTKVAPGVLVNIGSVVQGCGCAEGSACTDQVRVVSQRADQPLVLLLSKMNGHWDLRPVEQWERAAADLRQRRAEIVGPLNGPDFHNRSASFWNQVDLLNQMKPRCETAGAAGIR